MHTAELPRRERNRIQTWDAIHDAASTLALEHGLHGATIDAIVDRAGVSRRTFFNYFPTKEDAVLGAKPPVLSEEALAEFDATTDDPFGRVVRLMVSVIRSTVHDPSAFAVRTELVRRFPELRSRLDERLRESEDLVQTVIDRDGNDADSSRVLLLLAGSVMRFAYAHDPEGFVTDDSPAIEQSLIQFREVMKQLQ
jgi:AcrR family transcriptional regulator